VNAFAIGGVLMQMVTLGAFAPAPGNVPAQANFGNGRLIGLVLIIAWCMPTM
jgi:hypothetical protein